LTKNAYDISLELLSDVEKNLNRKYAVNEFNKYIDNVLIASEIERGLFENTLIEISQKNIKIDMFYPRYFFELHNICNNLDQENKSVNNQTFKPMILRGEIQPRCIAFMTPQQMHPMRYSGYYQKKERENETINNNGVYKDYENKCEKCGGVDFNSYTQQLRAADEPASKFITCIDCNHTVIQW
jgi:DNA-directed RNA polymerase subunit M/transcription elongation factor TFIIS